MSPVSLFFVTTSTFGHWVICVPAPEGMPSLYPLPLYESLEAVQGPGVGVQDDLGETGDSEAEIHAGVLCEEDGGPLNLQALGSQTGDVQQVSHVTQPPGQGVLDVVTHIMYIWSLSLRLLIIG